MKLPSRTPCARRQAVRGRLRGYTVNSDDLTFTGRSNGMMG